MFIVAVERSSIMRVKQSSYRQNVQNPQNLKSNSLAISYEHLGVMFGQITD